MLHIPMQKYIGEYIKKVEEVEKQTTWQALYKRAINEANGLTNYVEDRPELYSAEKRLSKIEADARDLLTLEQARK